MLKGSDTTSPYSYSWATTSAANGTHTVKATAYDTAGQTASSQVSVTVNNVAADAAPAVSFSAPLNGSSVSGGVTVTAAASDDKGVGRVEFYIDNVLKGTLTASPYTWTLNTALLANGAHTIKATAYDTAGQTASAQVSVTVNNTIDEDPSDPVTPPAPPADVVGVTVSAYPNPCVLASGAPDIRFAVSGISSGECRVYTLSGRLVTVLPLAGGTAGWDACNASGMQVGRGLYVYVADDGAGNKKTGKIIIR